MLGVSNVTADQCAHRLEEFFIKYYRPELFLCCHSISESKCVACYRPESLWISRKSKQIVYFRLPTCDIIFFKQLWEEVVAIPLEDCFVRKFFALFLRHHVDRVFRFLNQFLRVTIPDAVSTIKTGVNGIPYRGLPKGPLTARK